MTLGKNTAPFALRFFTISASHSGVPNAGTLLLLSTICLSFVRFNQVTLRNPIWYTFALTDAQPSMMRSWILTTEREQRGAPTSRRPLATSEVHPVFAWSLALFQPPKKSHRDPSVEVDVVVVTRVKTANGSR